MNSNFLGQIGREDVQILEQLRRQLLPMIGVIEKLRNDVDFRLSRGEAVDWPHIQRTTSAVNTYITGLNAYINGAYIKHTSEIATDTEGNPVRDKGTGQPVMIYRDEASLPHAKSIEALHPVPVAPCPVADERLGPMLQTLLQKKIDNLDAKWVEDRIAKAAQFSHIPPEWGIDPKKAEEPSLESSDGDFTESHEEGEKKKESMPTKRSKATFNEDQLVDLWGLAHKLAFDRKTMDVVDARQGATQTATAELEDDEEEEDEDEFEDVDMLSGAPVSTQAKVGENSKVNEDEDEDDDENGAAETNDAPRPLPIVKPAVPVIHKPSPGSPVMSLDAVQYFMTFGELRPATDNPLLGQTGVSRPLSQI